MRPMLLVLVACGGGEIPMDPTPTDPSIPTYLRDVAPIFAASCTTCHTEGGLAPFALDDPESARAWAAASAVAVEARVMPPWLVTDDGTCGTYVDSEWLSDEAIATIVAWADAGAPLGDPGSAAPLEPREPRTLDEIGLGAAIPPFVPEGPSDVYRCFLVPNDRAEEIWLTGYEGHPGNEAIVHHMAVYTVDPAGASWVEGVTNGQILAGLDAADEAPGWDCFGAAGDGVHHDGVPATWAPGQGAVPYPDGTGVRLRPEQDLVVQMHYHANGPIDAPDTSRVDFSVADDVDRELWFVPADAFLESWILAQYGIGESASIPKGEPAYRYTFSYGGAQMLADGGFDPEEPRAFDLVGVMPHMHGRGRKQWVAVDGACATEVLAWDFDWQRVYTYAEPIPLDAGSVAEITCEWDASDAEADVMPGWGTEDEMCLATLLLATDR